MNKSAQKFSLRKQRSARPVGNAGFTVIEPTCHSADADASSRIQLAAVRSCSFAHAKSRMTKAFTLIELSIVLVIIGLIIGGALVGRDLIESAKIRSQINQIEKLNTTVNTFKLKYAYLPGDLPNAVALGLGTNTSWHNGNGDGNIDNHCYKFQTSATHNYNKEAFALSMHLANAGMLEGSYEGYQGEANNAAITADMVKAKIPRAAYSNQFVVFPSRFEYSISCGPLNASYATTIREGGNGWAIGAIPPDIGGYVLPSLSEANTYRIDSKIDDGLPLSGNVGVSAASWASTVHFCIDTSCRAATYNPTLSTAVKPVFINQY